MCVLNYKSEYGGIEFIVCRNFRNTQKYGNIDHYHHRHNHQNYWNQLSFIAQKQIMSGNPIYSISIEMEY